MILYVVVLNMYYNEVPFVLYMALISYLVQYPITCLFISQKLKEMIILVQTKKDLVHTIQTILQTFPEGVIIRSVDPATKEVITKFANDDAERFVKKNEGSISISEDIQVNSMTNSIDLNENQNTFSSLDQFLQQQEQKIHNFEVSLSKMIEINEDLKSAENRYDVIDNKDDDIQDK